MTAARDKVEALTGLPAGKVADVLAEVISGLPEAVAADLATTAGCLADLPAGVRWSFDPTLVRGMGYYTSQIFEMCSTRRMSRWGRRWPRRGGCEIGRPGLGDPPQREAPSPADPAGELRSRSVSTTRPRAGSPAACRVATVRRYRTEST
ncbi:MAG: hypothetical protein ACRDQ7_24840 [Haloechinothrix sp.]